ncbi:hypothetical protein ABL78_5463 [Leptomonas seymouri]|uniref:Uncharacterized protein n=1 Tax=Leptomonas seymouri TaxID=5684 RepID=A0A0N1PDH8_LEPSE|nr:hypothetical protein ABL78_5463 [Leptomonas seymouri]|eukprot:KPI85470.1 hypothetical protein ABL78_5463 [Leptomonas seymouri]
MPQPKGRVEQCTPIALDAFLEAVRRLKSTDAQQAAVRLYACATTFNGMQSTEVAEARMGEAAAVSAMERIIFGQSTDKTADLAEAEVWGFWHSKAVAAEAKMESDIVAVMQSVMSRIPTVVSSTVNNNNGADGEPSNTATPHTTNTSALSSYHAETKMPLRNASATDKADLSNAQSSNGEPAELYANIVSNAINLDNDDHPNVNVSAEVVRSSDIALPALEGMDRKGVEEEDEAEGDTSVAENASTRTPTPREPVANGQSNNDHENDESEAALYLSADTSNKEMIQRSSLTSSKLYPSTVPAENVTSAENNVAPSHPPKRLCFEDYGLHFTQADFDAAFEELQRQRGGASKSSKDGDLRAEESSKSGDLGELRTERLASLLPQVEDTELHYVRRQLSVRHLQPFVCPLRALALRLAEGDTACSLLSAKGAHEAEDSESSQLSDPLMIRLLMELEEVCVKHPVPRVHVRPDAQVYRKDCGYFMADEARVQLHVEVVPVSGPMVGETIHVWVRVPAGYPFVAPRAHLTVELPHRRSTGIAVDRVPHLISLSYDSAVPDARDVCPAPLHADEVEHLLPLHGAVNSHWRSSLSLRHVLMALADLFNAEEFAETAKELRNENLMHGELQRARVSVFEEQCSPAAVRSVSNGENAAGEGSLGMAAMRDERVAPHDLLLCNGPFLIKPPAAATAAIATAHAAIPSPASADTSVERPSKVDGDDNDGGTCTSCPSAMQRSSASRRHQRKPLMYYEMESDRLCGPWQGCWGHVLYSTGSAAPAATAGATMPMSSPVSVGDAGIASAVPASAAVPAPDSEVGASAESFSGPPTTQLPQSPSLEPVPLLPSHNEGGGALFVRLKHHVPTASAATVRLVCVPAYTLRENGTASVADTSQRRVRNRPSPLSTWVMAALGTSSASPPFDAAWTSSAPSEMDTEVLICIHDGDEKTADSLSNVAATLPRGFQRQHVNLRNLREGGNSNVAAVTATEVNSPQTSDSALQVEEGGSGEQCYALVVDVPEGQEVSLVFSSDVEACLSVSWEDAAAGPQDMPMGADHACGDDATANVGAIMAAAQWEGGETNVSSNSAHGGVLVELPYHEWQFQAGPASTAAASGAKRIEDIYPHWPRNARFHGGHRVVPLFLKEATFHMYQLLQNSKVGGRGNAHVRGYLAGAPHARVRQQYCATRNAKEQEMMVRRYGFWGWRNVLLPVFSVETQELVRVALQAGSNANHDGGDSPPREPSEASAKMLAASLCSWEAAAIENFSAACVQLHRDPDASTVYRVPLRPFAVLRTLALTAAYALEVIQVHQKTQSGKSSCSRKSDTGRVPAPAEAAALLDCLNKILWHAKVLAVVTATVKPNFLRLCVALADEVKGHGSNCSTSDREAHLALAQLNQAQRRAAQMLAASAASAFPGVAAALVPNVSSAVEEKAAVPALSETSAAEAVA